MQAAAQDATPIASTATVVPTSTASASARDDVPVVAQDVTDLVDFTVRVWTCEGDATTEGDDAVFSATLGDATAPAGTCSLTPSGSYTNATEVLLVDAVDDTLVVSTVTNDGVAVFRNMPVGDYRVVVFRGNGTPFPVTLTADTTPLLDVVITYDVSDALATVGIAYLTCESADLADTYGFSTYSIGAASTAICSYDPLPTDGNLRVVLRDADANDYPVALQAAIGVPAGTYTATLQKEDATFIDLATSDPFTVVRSPIFPFLVTITHYVAPGTLAVPSPVAGGTGDVMVSTAYCNDPTRDGEADFIVVASENVDAAAISSCVAGVVVNGSYVLTNVDTNDTYAITLAGYALGSLIAEDIPTGTYVLSIAGTSLQSDPFTVRENTTTEIVVHLFTGAAVGNFSLVALTCLDPERAGTSEFVAIDSVNISPADASTTNECGVTLDPESPPVTLTNLDNGVTYTIETQYGPLIYNVIPGTYQLTTGDGVTSEPFEIPAASSITSVIGFVLQMFVGEGQFPIVENDVFLIVQPYFCTTTDQDARNTFIVVPEVAAVSADTAVANCTSGVATPLNFELVPADAVQATAPVTSYPFTLTSSGMYEVGFEQSIPSGDYVIRETTTDTTSEILTFGGWSSAFYLMMDVIPPTATPTATAAATSTPTATSTTASTATATATPDASVTATATVTPEVTETVAPTGTSTPSETATTSPEATAVTTGNVNATIYTIDGNTFPDDAIILLTSPNGEEFTPGGFGLASTGAIRAFVAAAASGSVVSFTEIPAGDYVLTVTNASPYVDYMQEVTVTAGETLELAITLQTEASSPTATVPGAATPIATGTVPPTTVSTETPAAGAPTTAAPAQPSGSGVAVTTLPKTGQGANTQGGELSLLLLLGAAMLTVLGAGLGLARRRMR